MSRKERMLQGVEPYVAGWIEDVAGVVHGAAFPADPWVGLRCFRTDRGVEYYWTGQRWLSTQETPLVLAQRLMLLPITGADVPLGGNRVVAEDTIDVRHTVYWTACMARCYVATTNDSTNYWRVQLNLQAANGAFSRTLWDFTTGVGANTVFYVTATPNVVGFNTEWMAYLQVQRIGTPGDLSVDAKALYRLIG